MIHFESDYTAGAHPLVLQRLLETNLEQSPGYGADDHCQRARDMLRTLCQAPGADVQFLTGGTQANLTVIAAVLRPWEGVACAETGHIQGHEGGAVEATGHRVIPLPSSDGKITALQLEELCQQCENDPNGDHLVRPGMVYLSHPTELGTVYTRGELEEISRTARRHGLSVFVDGARLVYGLAASDLTLPDLARLCDVFYLGGTKAGTLFGEAVVLVNPQLQRNFRNMMKQRGAMLAKGWLLGVQFEGLLSDGLYLEIGRKAVAQAIRIQRAVLEKGWSLLVPSPTNQQFPILPDRVLEELSRRYVLSPWGRVDEGHSAARICTSWSTRKEDVEALIRDIQAL